jgi:hypothetical protein
MHSAGSLQAIACGDLGWQTGRGHPSLSSDRVPPQLRFGSRVHTALATRTESGLTSKVILSFRRRRPRRRRLRPSLRRGREPLGGRPARARAGTELRRGRRAGAGQPGEPCHGVVMASCHGFRRRPASTRSWQSQPCLAVVTCTARARAGLGAGGRRTQSDPR